MEDNWSFTPTEEEAAQAATQEENDRLQNEILYLRNRVVGLRAMVNRQRGEIQSLLDMIPTVDVEPGEGIDPTN